MTNISSVSLVRPARVSGGPRTTCSSPRRVASRRFYPRCAVFGRCHIACNQQRFGGLRRGVSNTRLTDALLQLRPFVPPKDSVGPDALGVPGPCFAARETSENLQMIFQRRKRLAFAPAASDVRISDCVKRLFRSGIGAATALRPQSHWGHGLARRSHGYPDFLPRLIHWRDVCVAWIRLPSVVATWGHSRPNAASVKLNSFAAESPMRQTKSDRRGLPARVVLMRTGKGKVGENAIAHELGHKAVIKGDDARLAS
jgi:hypothetical protein